MDKLIVEVQVEGTDQTSTLELSERDLGPIVQAIRNHAGLGDGVYIYERGNEEVLTGDFKSRRAITAVVSRCKEILVDVRFEHKTASKTFKPSTTIGQVLAWARDLKEFGLDTNGKAKANLILPGGDQPLSRDATLAQFLDGKQCKEVFDLTLKEFTNG